jgi:hypothetical protein
VEKYNDYRYIFVANAFGVSGQFADPLHNLAVQAGSALPPDGGYDSSFAKGFRHENILSFGRAHTKVTGSNRGGVYTTFVESVVEDFKFGDFLACDRLVAQLTATYPGNCASGKTENALRCAGSRFEGLRVPGFHGDLKVDPIFDEHACFTGLQAAVKGGNLNDFKLRVSEDDYPQEASLLGFVGCGKKFSFKAEGYSVNLAELFCSSYSRGLTMIRIARADTPASAEPHAVERLTSGGSDNVNAGGVMCNSWPYPPPGQ